jgi:hypothetical protein
MNPALVAVGVLGAVLYLRGKAPAKAAAARPATTSGTSREAAAIGLAGGLVTNLFGMLRSGGSTDSATTPSDYVPWGFGEEANYVSTDD